MSELHDVVVAPADAGYALPDGLVRSFLRSLSGRGVVEPAGEALARTWVEVYLKPGVYAHRAFAEGTAPEGPAFLGATFRFADEPAPLPGHPAVSTRFHLVFYGARHADVLGTFKQQFEELLHCRVRALSCAHDGVPAPLDVPEDEARPPAKQRQAPGGAVGTTVEEF